MNSFANTLEGKDDKHFPECFRTPKLLPVIFCLGSALTDYLVVQCLLSRRTGDLTGMSIAWLACSCLSLLVAKLAAQSGSTSGISSVSATRTSIDSLTAPHLDYGHRVAFCLA